MIWVAPQKSPLRKLTEKSLRLTDDDEDDMHVSESIDMQPDFFPLKEEADHKATSSNLSSLKKTKLKLIDRFQLSIAMNKELTKDGFLNPPNELGIYPDYIILKALSSYLRAKKQQLYSRDRPGWWFLSQDNLGKIIGLDKVRTEHLHQVLQAHMRSIDDPYQHPNYPN